MGGIYDNHWQTGIYTRLVQKDSPVGDRVVGLIFPHPHRSSDLGTITPTILTEGPVGVIVLAVQGYKVPLEVRVARDGVEDDEPIVISNGIGWELRLNYTPELPVDILSVKSI